MIWKAPWGNHIDLDRIISVQVDGPDIVPSFKIYFQLMDNPIHVSFNRDRHINLIQEHGSLRGLLTQWHDELIAAWTKHKASK